MVYANIFQGLKLHKQAKIIIFIFAPWCLHNMSTCPWTRIAHLFLNFGLRVYQVNEKEGRGLISDMHVQNKKYKNNWLTGFSVHLLRCHSNPKFKRLTQF